MTTPWKNISWYQVQDFTEEQEKHVFTHSDPSQ